MSARQHERDSERTFGWRTVRRSIIALIGASALALGPGALAAYAVDEGADQASTAQAVGPDAAGDAGAGTPAETPAEQPAPEPAAPPAEGPVDSAPVEPAVEAPAEDPIAAPVAPADPVAPPADDAEDADSGEPAAPVDDSSAARAVAPAASQSQQPAEASARGGNDANITFCHWRGQENGWAKPLTSNANSIISQGHTSHQGNRDIIPPFTVKQGNKTLTYPGLNWDAEGQAILANGCKEVPPEVEPPAMALSATPECIDADSSTQEMLAVLVSQVKARSGVNIEVTGPNGFTKTLSNLSDGTTAFALGAPGEYNLTLLLAGETVSTMELTFDSCEEEPPVYVGDTQVCHFISDEAGWEMRTVTGEEFANGYAEDNPRSIFNNFTFTVNGEEVAVVGQHWDAEGQAFFENDCQEVPPVVDPPAMTLAATPECIDADATSQETLAVLVTQVNNRAGVSIEVTGPNDFAQTLTGVGDGTATVTLGDSGAYQLALIFGEKVVKELDVTVAPCDVKPPVEPPVEPPVKPGVVTPTPVVQVTPGPKATATTAVKQLAVTGDDGNMWLAMVGALLLVGGITVLAGYRSRGNDYRPHGRR